MDNTVILAFLVGLLTTVIGLYHIRGSKKHVPVLDPKEFKEFPLVKKVQMTPNTALYRFSLPSPDDVLGLPIGQHITIAATIGGKQVTRSYTPTSSDDDLGHFDLVVKTYPQGVISSYFSRLNIGDRVLIKGPKGQFQYHPTLVPKLSMIAGGTGLTPMLQIVRAAMKNPSDKTRIRFIYANVNEEDIILREELDQLVKDNNGRFEVYYVLNNPPTVWPGGVGFVTRDMIEKRLWSNGTDVKTLLCGPPPMIQAMKKHLADIGYPAPRTVSKLEDAVFCF